MPISKPIDLPRLMIRPFDAEKEQDITDAHAYLGDSEVMKFTPEGALSAAETRRFVALQAKERRVYAIWHKTDRKVIGHLIYHPYEDEYTYEIGWFLNRSYQGQKYGTEASTGIIRHAFEQDGLHRLVATCDTENAPSWRLLERVGMRREGRFIQNVLLRGKWRDTYFYARLEQDNRQNHEHSN